MFETLNEWWERKFFRVAAYMAFGFLSFFVFLLWTFPGHRVQTIAANHLEVLFDHEYDVSIGKVGFWRLTGVEMEQIRLRERLSPEEEEETRPTTINLERISVRFSPLRSLLNRAPTARYQIDVGGSVIDGTAYQTGPNLNVSMSLNRVDLRQSTLLAGLLGLPIFGILDGDIDLVMNTASGQLMDGRVDITGEMLTLGTTVIQSEQIPVFTELELPTTSFGNMEMLMTVEQAERGSRINVERFRTRGRDINTELWGHVDLLPHGGQPRLQLRLQVNQEYVTEHGLGLLFNVSEFRDGEYRDWYGFVLAGSFDNISFNGSTTAAQGPPEEGGDEDEGGADDEG